MLGAPPPAEERLLAVPGGRVYCRRFGGGPATPLLVLHGGPGMPHDYLWPLAILADEQPVVFYDQLGCGRSDHPADPALWCLDRFVAEVASVRAGLALDRVCLFGHSWGAMLAVEYALGQPPGLEALVLASPVLSVPRYVADLARLCEQLPPEARAQLEALPDARNMPDGGAGLAVYRVLWGECEARPTGRLAGFDRTARLGELAVPTLFTCGERDPATPAATAADQARVPGARLQVFVGAGHNAHLEQPDEFVAVVREFLRGVVTRRRAPAY